MALLLAIIFILLIKSLTLTSFETNDDALFMMFSSGFYTGNPFEYLIATPAITGKVLTILYTRVPSISWYGWYLMLGHFLAIVGFLYSGIKNFRSYKILLFIAFVLVVFE
ncbi:MAG: hypothetical protein K2Q22_06575, partial [Cytophagales bacterium]|nr:hypothetical protein [Cytophagales bacterium]